MRTVVKHKIGKTNNPVLCSSGSFKVKHYQMQQSPSNNNQQQRSMVMTSQMSFKALANQGDLEEDEQLQRDVLSEDESTMLAVAAEYSANSKGQN